MPRAHSSASILRAKDFESGGPLSLRTRTRQVVLPDALMRFSMVATSDLPANDMEPKLYVRRDVFVSSFGEALCRSIEDEDVDEAGNVERKQRIAHLAFGHF